MKRLLLVLVAILVLSFSISGCGKVNKLQNADQNNNTPATYQATKQGSSQNGEKPQTPAEIDAQAEKVQNQIDQLLNDLNNDSDEQNINAESK